MNNVKSKTVKLKSRSRSPEISTQWTRWITKMKIKTIFSHKKMFLASINRQTRDIKASIITPLLMRMILIFR
jgi:hypothetical protein